MPTPRISTRYVWLPVVLILMGIGTAAILTARQTPVYRSATTMILAPSSLVESTADFLRSLDTLERRSVIATLAEIPAAPSTRAATAEQLGRSPASLRPYRIVGSVMPYTNILRVDVEGQDPAEVAAVANAVADVTAREARDLYRIFSMRQLAQAVPPARPVSPDPSRNYWVGAIVGLFLGLAAAFVLDRFEQPGRAAAFEPATDTVHRLAR
jgi:capsular polysaccharide biosynthesis protein